MLGLFKKKNQLPKPNTVFPDDYRPNHGLQYEETPAPVDPNEIKLPSTVEKEIKKQEVKQARKVAVTEAERGSYKHFVSARKDRARYLRKRGKSAQYIMKHLNISSSTFHEYTKGVEGK